MHPFDSFWPWITLLALGGFHGLNPAMGWLFAVSLGFQERRLHGVVKALGPITLGHALAIAVVAVPFGLLGLVMPQNVLLVIIGLVLLGFAGYKFFTRFRHPRWVGMRVRPRELVLWSFLMATAHGAGLMIVPVLAGMRGDAVPRALAESGHADHMAHMANMMPMDHNSPEQVSAGGDALGHAAAAVALHSAAMLVVTGLIAIVVFRKVGVDVLRRAWINLDLIWFGAFVVAGMVTLGLGVWNSWG
jgi:hypothetical protein